jgi:hypothetical protein
MARRGVFEDRSCRKIYWTRCGGEAVVGKNFGGRKELGKKNLGVRPSDFTPSSSRSLSGFSVLVLLSRTRL